MIVRTAVTEAKLRHVSRQGADKPGSMVEAGTLRLHSSCGRPKSRMAVHLQSGERPFVDWTTT
jgi:hypothetical protein